MKTTEHYAQFFERFTTEKYESYLRNLGVTIEKYSFSTTPYFLPRKRFERLVEITNSLLKLLKSPAYHEQTARTSWFLPHHTMRPTDYFGDVEFHCGDVEDKILEVNFNPPGHVGFLELLEGAFLNAFDVPHALRVNEGFEERLVDAVTDHRRYTKIAVGVNHTAASKPYMAHYKYFEKIFSRHGIESRVVYAADVQMDEAFCPMWDGRPFDRILNLVIPRIWEDNPEPFSKFTLAYKHHPEMFFPNPFGWRLGQKRLQAVCYNLENENFGLEEKDVEIITKASLETYMLSDFSSPSELMQRFEGKDFVLKPLDNYHGKGLFIRPSVESIEQVFDSARDRYIAQQYFPPSQVPCITTGGAIENYLFSLRLGFLNGEFFGARGYNFTIPPSSEHIVPVVVV